MIVLAATKRSIHCCQRSEKNRYNETHETAIVTNMHSLPYVTRNGGILRDYELPEFW